MGIDAGTIRPTSTSTTTDARSASKARASRPSQKQAASRPEPTIVEKGLKAVGLEGAAREARRGAREAERAVQNQPTPERKAVVAVAKAAETTARTAAAAAVEVATPVVKAGKKHADRISAPARREAAEARTEVTDAAKGVGTAAGNSASELARETSNAWKSQPTIERKVVVAGAEVAENLVQGNLRTAGAVAKLGLEAAEGVAELALNNPAIEQAKIVGSAAGRGVQAAGSAAADGVRALGSTLFGFGQARIEGGAKGASSAAETAGSARDEIRDRSRAQAAENRQEIGDAATTYREGWVSSLNPFDDDEVQSAWKDQPTIERRIAVAGYETAETIVQDMGSNLVNFGNLTKEVGEGVVEDTITGARNVGTAVSGGAKAVGSFVGGIFGG